MTFTSIEIIALIVILAAAIKMIVLVINPKSWMNFSQKVMGNKNLTQIVGFILAVVVLYYLLQDGMNIVQILAVTAFVALLMIIGLADDIGYFVKKYQAQIKKHNLWKKHWFYTLLWIILLVWGALELLNVI